VWNRATSSFSSDTTGAPGGSLNSRLLSTSGNGRTDYWRVALKEIAAHPLLGGGAGSFDRWWLARRPTGYGALDAHNLYLETLAELGPIGLALLVAALVLPFVRLVRVRRIPLAAACGAAYVAFLAHAALDWDLELTGVGLAGVLCGAAIVGAGEARPAPVRRPRRVAALAVLGSLAAFVFVLHVGNVSLAHSGSALDRDDTRAAARAARRAERWQPWSARPLVALGEAQLVAGDVETAAATFRRAVRRDPGDWQGWYDLGLATRGAERLRALAAAARLNPRAPALAALRP
jgi:O-antigen ligase